MKLLVRPVRFLGVAWALGAAALLAQKPAAAPTAAPAPKLAVVIAVDGLSMSRLLFWRPWYVAGLKRLLDEGQVETNATYRHLNTETGPGHASLGTGAPPRVHGITINSWFEERPGRGLVSVYCTDQPDPSNPAGSTVTIPGPANLRVPTLGDDLVAQKKGARVVSISGKDRAAIFLAGRNPGHAAFWYDKATGRFTTSAAYDTRSAAAKLVDRFNLQMAGGTLPARFGLLWRKWGAPAPASPNPLPTPVPPAVIQSFQVPAIGLGWDKDLSRYVSSSRFEPSGYFSGIYRSPLVDELTADLALTFLSDPSFELGRHGVPDLLAISFSGNDPVSHDFGFESEETLDALRRLDVQIGRILDALEKAFPKGSVLVAFSADHGFSPIPEVAKAGGRVVGNRTYTNNMVDKLNRMLADELCFDRSVRPIFGLEGWSLFYRRTVFPIRSVEGTCGAAGRQITPSDVDRALPKLVKLGWDEEISGVFLSSTKDSWPAGDPATEYVRNAFDVARSGDAFLIPRPGVLTIWDPGRGSMHGSHHDADTHVPLVFWGGPAKPGTSAAPATPYDLAPTVGAWLGVTVPDATGRAIPLGK